jgi:hypothetical protein
MSDAIRVDRLFGRVRLTPLTLEGSCIYEELDRNGNVLEFRITPDIIRIDWGGGDVQCPNVNGNWLNSPGFHKGATIGWATIGLAVSITFPNSVPWLVFMSLWANVVGHWSAYQAARSEREAKK